ncbi:MAG: hypothetical protein Q8O12_04960 [Candidatus Omnitrophota bacterium]|nr:hypothetical protein [Candidatus Omnitrophota bacterium]
MPSGKTLVFRALTIGRVSVLICAVFAVDKAGGGICSFNTAAELRLGIRYGAIPKSNTTAILPTPLIGLVNLESEFLCIVDKTGGLRQLFSDPFMPYAKVFNKNI